MIEKSRDIKEEKKRLKLRMASSDWSEMETIAGESMELTKEQIAEREKQMRLDANRKRMIKNAQASEKRAKGIGQKGVVDN